MDTRSSGSCSQSSRASTDRQTRFCRDRLPSDPGLLGTGAQPATGGRGRPRILAIDDDPISLEVFRKALTGVDLVTASSGEQGLELGLGSSFDLVLLDIVMPGIDGFEVLRRFRADSRRALTPVVLLTVLSEPAHVIRGFECGADDYLIKPIERWELRARVRTQIDRCRLRQDLMARQKQETLQRIALGLSHEINNPLFVIRGFTELLESDVDEASRPHVERILRATERVSAIVRGLGELARAGSAAGQAAGTDPRFRPVSTETETA